MFYRKEGNLGLPCGLVAKTLCSQYRGPEFDTGQETRSHMPQPKLPRATTKIQHSQIF